MRTAAQNNANKSIPSSSAFSVLLQELAYLFKGSSQMRATCLLNPPRILNLRPELSRAWAGRGRARIGRCSDGSVDGIFMRCNDAGKALFPSESSSIDETVF